MLARPLGPNELFLYKATHWAVFTLPEATPQTCLKTHRTLDHQQIGSIGLHPCKTLSKEQGCIAPLAVLRSVCNTAFNPFTARSKHQLKQLMFYTNSSSFDCVRPDLLLEKHNPQAMQTKQKIETLGTQPIFKRSCDGHSGVDASSVGSYSWGIRNNIFVLVSYVDWCRLRTDIPQ